MIHTPDAKHIICRIVFRPDTEPTKTNKRFGPDPDVLSNDKPEYKTYRNVRSKVEGLLFSLKDIVNAVRSEKGIYPTDTPTLDP